MENVWHHGNVKYFPIPSPSPGSCDYSASANLSSFICWSQPSPWRAGQWYYLHGRWRWCRDGCHVCTADKSVHGATLEALYRYWTGWVRGKNLVLFSRWKRFWRLRKEQVFIINLLSVPKIYVRDVRRCTSSVLWGCRQTFIFKQLSWLEILQPLQMLATNPLLMAPVPFALLLKKVV